MTETQKLREALQVARDHIDMDALEISHCKDAALIRQALALPTAAPVGERLTLPAEDVHAAFVKHFPKTRISQAWIGFAAEIAEAIAARAAPSAGDAVDAARYRWLREQESDDFEFAVVKNPHFDVYQSGKELDAAIDAAMRKEKP